MHAWSVEWKGFEVGASWVKGLASAHACIAFPNPEVRAPVRVCCFASFRWRYLIRSVQGISVPSLAHADQGGVKGLVCNSACCGGGVSGTSTTRDLLCFLYLTARYHAPDARAQPVRDVCGVWDGRSYWLLVSLISCWLDTTVLRRMCRPMLAGGQWHINVVLI